MESWNRIKLGELGKTYTGLSGKKKEDFGYGEPYIPYLNIFTNSRINPNFVEYVCIKEGEIQNKVSFGDLFFTTSSETIEEVGMTSVLLNEIGETYLNSFCFGFRLNDFNTLLPEFARYLFRSQLVRHQISLRGQGSTRFNLSKTALLNTLYLDIPPKPEQTHIAEILSTVDEAIEQTEKLIAKYQHIKTGLMLDILTRGIDEHGNIRSKATHKFVIKKGIEVPEEWEVKSIGEITDHIGSGITPKGGSNVYEFSGVMLIRSQNVLVGKFNFNDVAFITEKINLTMKRSELRDLDVLLNITGASIGRSHYIQLNFPKANVNQHVCSIRIKNASIGKSFFVSSYLNSPTGQLQIKRLLGASNREGLNYQQIREITIPLPKIEKDDEFQRIYSVIVPITDHLETEEKKLLKLQLLKTGLLQDLLSGRVRVNVEEKLDG